MISNYSKGRLHQDIQYIMIAKYNVILGVLSSLMPSFSNWLSSSNISFLHFVAYTRSFVFIIIIFIRDDVENYSSTVVSDRFVKWVNRRNVFINFQEHQIEKRTKENLFGKNEAAATVSCDDGWRVNNNDKYNRDEHFTTTGDKHDKNDDDDSKSTSLFWECIPNNDSQLEMCVTTTTDVQVNNNNEYENENENANESSSSKSTSNNHTGIPYDDNYLIC